MIWSGSDLDGTRPINPMDLRLCLDGMLYSRIHLACLLVQFSSSVLVDGVQVILNRVRTMRQIVVLE